MGVSLAQAKLFTDYKMHPKDKCFMIPSAPGGKFWLGHFIAYVNGAYYDALDTVWNPAMSEWLDDLNNKVSVYAGNSTRRLKETGLWTKPGYMNWECPYRTAVEFYRSPMADFMRPLTTDAVWPGFSNIPVSQNLLIARIVRGFVLRRQVYANKLPVPTEGADYDSIWRPVALYSEGLRKLEWDSRDRYVAMGSTVRFDLVAGFGVGEGNRYKKGDISYLVSAGVLRIFTEAVPPDTPVTEWTRVWQWLLPSATTIEQCVCSQREFSRKEASVADWFGQLAFEIDGVGYGNKLYVPASIGFLKPRPTLPEITKGVIRELVNF